MITHSSAPSTNVVWLPLLSFLSYDAQCETSPEDTFLDDVSFQDPVIFGGLMRHLLVLHLVAPELTSLRLSEVTDSDLLTIRRFMQASNSAPALDVYTL
ncbi:hypothetical protein BDV98DRAFT_274983 [Pterulicium gracile]|uniref:Uncharacterized protein n=1 Tax=Pterulicium gracile TaxID=1884261 RepID=A0A5C3Q9L8_9AGAR|nr:hypothetical protein BDV98DRAFT_274983 [Pterula gracilis]